MQQRSATEQEAYAVYQYILKFDLYLKGVRSVLHCDHKPLKPFLSKGIKIPKLNRWSMELADYNIFVCAYQRQTQYISSYYLQVKMLSICEELLVSL